MLLRELPTRASARFTEIAMGLFTDEKPPGVIAVPVSGYVKKDGKGVMMKGCAKEAKRRFKGIDVRLGTELVKQGRLPGNAGLKYFNGNVPAIIWDKPMVVSFPTQWFFLDRSDLSLIRQSCYRLMDMADFYKWNRIYLPKVGCGQGGRDWETEVRPELAEILDNRFIICTPV